MARRRSYFPAVNQQLQQFQGTELSPPGEGTYYKSSRYAGAPANIQRQAARNLGQAWQSDLAYNVQANPRIAGALQAERIGAQYGGGGSWAGRKGYQMVYGPDGGSAVVSDKVANKMISGGVYSSTPPELRKSNLAVARQLGEGPPPPVIQNGYSISGGVASPVENLTSNQRIQSGIGTGFDQLTNNPALAAGWRFGMNNLRAVGTLGASAFNYVRNQLGGGNNATVANANQPSGYSPSNPSLQTQPRRYFDYY